MTPFSLSTLQMKPLKTLSPSRFVRMKACTLREVWAAGKQPPLLPSSPHAHLGTVIHRFWEEVWKRRIGDHEMIALWQHLIDREQKTMRATWLEEHLAPLQNALPDYETRRQLCFLRQWPQPGGFTEKTTENILTGPEKPVWDGDTPESSEVYGLIDLVTADGDDYTIVDEKTGAVLTETGNVKEEYQLQLRLYAALFERRSGIWPTRLIVRDLLQRSHSVTFTSQECSQLLSEAQQTLRDTNKHILQGATAEDLAAPAPDECRYCGYRPACPAYWKARHTGGEWPHDVRGTISEAPFTQRNGNLRVVIGGAEKDIAVCDLSRHPDVNSLRAGSTVAIYSVRPEMTHTHPRAQRPNRYEATRMTTLYTDCADGG